MDVLRTREKRAYAICISRSQFVKWKCLSSWVERLASSMFVRGPETRAKWAVESGDVAWT